MIEKNM